MLQPVGPRPPYVYWVRRIVLLAIVTVVLVLAAHACSGGGSRARDASLRQRADQQPAAGTSALPTPSASSAAARTPACRARDLALSVSTDSSSYRPGVEPRFTAVVRNNGPTCRFPTALASRTWRILSGSYQVWSTADCPRSPAGRRVALKAGAQVSYVLTWDRFGSVPGCAAAGPRAQPGTYRLYVTIAGASAPAAVFVLAR